MGWGMMSEYILGDGFESGGGYSSNGRPGSGCLLLIVCGFLTVLFFTIA